MGTSKATYLDVLRGLENISRDILVVPSSLMTIGLYADREAHVSRNIHFSLYFQLCWNLCWYFRFQVKEENFRLALVSLNSIPRRQWLKEE